VLALADVVHLLADKFTGGRGGVLPLVEVLLGPLSRTLFSHVVVLRLRQRALVNYEVGPSARLVF
jgi:hypothetical protein